MSDQRTDLPDVELALTTWARDAFQATVCTELPADLEGSLPLVQVEAIGGFGERFTASPRIDVDVYAADYSAAKDLSTAVHRALVMLHGTVGQVVIRGIRPDTLPARRPYDNSSLRRVGASYTVTARPASFT